MIRRETTTSTLLTLNGYDDGSSGVYSNGLSNNRSRAVPGRARKQRKVNVTSSLPPRRKNKKTSFCYRFYSRWIKHSPVSAYYSLCFSVVLWYCLGVVGITTSKLLLLNNTPPMFLTLQQLTIGCCLLRFLIDINFMGSPGVQPLGPPGFPFSTFSSKPSSCSDSTSSPTMFGRPYLLPPSSRPYSRETDTVLPSHLKNLLLSGIFFALGFLATNMAFHSGSTAFVETIKASEPITSAIVAVFSGLETLSPPEIISLGSIVSGVVLSTISNGSNVSASSASASSSSFLHNYLHSSYSSHSPTSSVEVTDSTHAAILTLSQSIQCCFIVVLSNVCFSLRGLFQKHFQNSPEGNSNVFDDLNMQYRMQQSGVLLLLIPVLLWDLPQIVINIYHHFGNSTTTGDLAIGDDGIESGNSNSSHLFLRYIVLALVNGIAFTSYNLASTFILTRLSVVHHATLNCIRRIFSIIITSIIFFIPITFLGVLGFIISVGGFLCFTHYKVKRQRLTLRQPSYTSLLPTHQSPLLGNN